MKKNKKKLNLGCGNKSIDGFIGVDKFGSPEILVDLEKTPWPWKKNSVDEVILSHVLEHLGANTDIFLNIMKELYRVCTNGAIIHIDVPDPRSGGFLGDPTHVRAITKDVLALFSKKENHKFVENGWPNTTLALFLDIDFEIIDYKIDLMPIWKEKFESSSITMDELNFAISHYFNVVNELKFKLQVIK
ncbi:MAG: hypothetical protein U9Q20_02365 [Campylobacterota bacterium]|nr:hypothetical protein [Campylobacterota bacterium]